MKYSFLIDALILSLALAAPASKVVSHFYYRSAMHIVDIANTTLQEDTTGIMGTNHALSGAATGDTASVTFNLGPSSESHKCNQENAANTGQQSGTNKKLKTWYVQERSQ
ncbi:hypothetical protein BDV29DRAFT_155124 [Aspergillus leporis]|jgi:hypothetical protein|uniref:Uncharacterized protein n=1 Tax=Aspergillus leporis TaxID=41062 RepID=A0A5N5X950_9EURO|nr:hypothetical protein BDV29DRAFT_155124 [Aspergillus leporis]